MGTVLIVTLFLFILEGFCDDFNTRCLFFAKQCVNHCPRNMHPYHMRCDMDSLSQRTCEEPFVYKLGYTCGWSRCDCNGDLLLDELSYTCVDYLTCVAERNLKPSRRRQPKLHTMPKKLRLPEKDQDGIQYTP